MFTIAQSLNFDSFILARALALFQQRIQFQMSIEKSLSHFTTQYMLFIMLAENEIKGRFCYLTRSMKLIFELFHETNSTAFFDLSIASLSKTLYKAMSHSHNR